MLVGFGLQPSCCLAQTLGESVLQDQWQENCKEGFCRKKVVVREGLAALLMVLRREKEASGKNPKPVVVGGVSGGAVTQPVLSDCCQESGPSPAGDLTASGDTGPSAAHPVCFRNVQLNQIKNAHHCFSLLYQLSDTSSLKINLTPLPLHLTLCCFLLSLPSLLFAQSAVLNFLFLLSVAKPTSVFFFFPFIFSFHAV